MPAGATRLLAVLASINTLLLPEQFTTADLIGGPSVATANIDTYPIPDASYDYEPKKLINYKVGKDP